MEKKMQPEKWAIRMRFVALICAASLLSASCQKTPTPPAEPTRSNEPAKEFASIPAVPPMIQKQWTYLNRLRQTDDYSNLVSRTLLASDGQLGVVFYSRVTGSALPAELRKIAAEVAKRFPKQNVTLAGYAGTVPPRRAGVVHVDGATAETVYTPVK
ncbi:MAG: hypothetical protein ACR2G0_03455 [Chthoniobacterales bacterium]